MQVNPQLLVSSPFSKKFSFPSLPVLGTVTSPQDLGSSTSLPDPPSFSYRHCSPCDFGRGGTALGRSHLSQTSRRMGCRNLTGGKKRGVWDQLSIKRPEHFFWPSCWITGKNEVTSCSFTWPDIPQGSPWNLSTVTHSLVENKGYRHWSWSAPKANRGLTTDFMDPVPHYSNTRQGINIIHAWLPKQSTKHLICTWKMQKFT